MAQQAIESPPWALEGYPAPLVDSPEVSLVPVLVASSLHAFVSPQ